MLRADKRAFFTASSKASKAADYLRGWHSPIVRKLQREGAMARAIGTATMKQRPQYEPLYDVDPRTGASIEIFFADRVLAKSFGTHPGGTGGVASAASLPDDLPTGPFANSYLAYRDFAPRWTLRPDCCGDGKGG